MVGERFLDAGFMRINLACEPNNARGEIRSPVGRNFGFRKLLTAWRQFPRSVAFPTQSRMTKHHNPRPEGRRDSPRFMRGTPRFAVCPQMPIERAGHVAFGSPLRWASALWSRTSWEGLASRYTSY